MTRALPLWLSACPIRSNSNLPSEYVAARPEGLESGCLFGDRRRGDEVATEQTRRIVLEQQSRCVDQDDLAGLHGIEHVEPVFDANMRSNAGTCRML